MENWYCVGTVVRKEGVAGACLETAGLEVFAPKIQRVVADYYARRLRGEALFPGYIFARGDLDRMMDAIRFWRQMRRATGIHNLVGRVGEPCPVEAWVIDEIQSHIADGFFIPPGKPPVIYEELKAGEYVRITKGVFAGWPVQFDRMKGSDRCIVLMEMMGAKRPFEIDRSDLEQLTFADEE